MAASDSYALRGGAAGRERLRVLSRVLAPTTGALLDRVGLAPGASCLDVGCGGGDVTRALARRAGPQGRVVGVDVDPEALEIARRETEAEGLAGVEYHVLGVDALTGLPGAGRFDVVYARFLLSHLLDPAGAARTLAACVRPGGIVAVEDIDFAGHFVHPPDAAFDRYLDLYAQVVRRRGGHADLGPRLPGLLLGAGLSEVDVAVAQPVGLRGDAKRLNPLTMASIAGTVVADGLATRAETDALTAALDAYANDETTLAGLPRVVQAWGRRPDA